MNRQQNRPNWYQTVSVYRPGEAEPIEQFTIEQSWDRSLASHRRLRRAAVETVEGLRDKTGFQYILWSPEARGGATIPSADRQHITVD